MAAQAPGPMNLVHRGGKKDWPMAKKQVETFPGGGP
jgi:hypothetical protein